jgi:hypothetical protein
MWLPHGALAPIQHMRCHLPPIWAHIAPIWRTWLPYVTHLVPIWCTRLPHGSHIALAAPKWHMQLPDRASDPILCLPPLWLPYGAHLWYSAHGFHWSRFIPIPSIPTQTANQSHLSAEHVPTLHEISQKSLPWCSDCPESSGRLF